MTSWNLRKHGDRIEKKWRTKIAQHFKMYEPFWSLHVAPLTYRVVSEKERIVRTELLPERTQMASASYGVFTHLAGCNDQLEQFRPHTPKPEELDLFATEGAYMFYSRLYCVADMVNEKYLPATNDIVQKYNGPYVPEDAVTKKYQRFRNRLTTNGKMGLATYSCKLDDIEIREFIIGAFLRFRARFRNRSICRTGKLSTAKVWTLLRAISRRTRPIICSRTSLLMLSLRLAMILLRWRKWSTMFGTWFSVSLTSLRMTRTISTTN